MGERCKETEMKVAVIKSTERSWTKRDISLSVKRKGEEKEAVSGDLRFGRKLRRPQSPNSARDPWGNKNLRSRNRY